MADQVRTSQILNFVQVDVHEWFTNLVQQRYDSLYNNLEKVHTPVKTECDKMKAISIPKDRSDYSWCRFIPLAPSCEV